MNILSQGIHGSGARQYTARQYAEIVRLIQAEAGRRSLTVKELSDRTGISGRTVREIVSNADGDAFLIGGDSNDGYRLASCRSDAERSTARMESQMVRMRERVRRRRALADLAFVDEPKQMEFLS